jgi:hypothetical protein
MRSTLWSAIFSMPQPDLRTRRKSSIRQRRQYQRKQETAFSQERISTAFSRNRSTALAPSGGADSIAWIIQSLTGFFIRLSWSAYGTPSLSVTYLYTRWLPAWARCAGSASVSSCSPVWRMPTILFSPKLQDRGWASRRVDLFRLDEPIGAMDGST